MISVDSCAPDVALAGAEIASLHRVREQAVDAVAVVRVVLGRVDPALGGDRVRAARRVLVTERLDRVAHAGEGACRARPGEARADDGEHVVLAAPGPDELVVVLPDAPLLVDRAVGDAGVSGFGSASVANKIGIAAKPTTVRTVRIVARRRQNQFRSGLSMPAVCAPLQSACCR
jgi:hypothetical protein